MDGSFIGSTIYLISHSDIRYEGVLVNIDPQESTLTLQNGTCGKTRACERDRDRQRGGFSARSRQIVISSRKRGD